MALATTDVAPEACHRRSAYIISEQGKLAGGRLVGNCHAPIEITELPDGSLDGYSECWNCTCAGTTT